MATTCKLIAKSTVGSGGASEIDFQNIPNTYTDLLVTISCRGTNTSYSNLYVGIKFNNSTSNQSARVLWGINAAAGSFTDTKIYVPQSGGSMTANTFGSGYFYIPNYAGSTNKSISGESASESNSASTPELYAIAGLWSNTAAIDRITLYDAFAFHNFAQHTTAQIYGITKA